MRTVVVVVTAALLASAPTAEAKPGPQDHRPCVSYREFAGGKNLLRQTKYQIETRWEVRGLGRDRKPITATSPDGFAVFYPACGFSVDEAWVRVDYDANRRSYSMRRFRGEGATVHGHN